MLGDSAGTGGECGSCDNYVLFARCLLLTTLTVVQSTNHSIFIYIRQPEPIVATHIEEKKNAHNTVQNYHTDRREKRETVAGLLIV